MTSNAGTLDPEPSSVYPVTVDREGRRPIFEQLADVYRGKISSGEWRPDRSIPNELDLAEQSAELTSDGRPVDRDTVRRAKQELIKDGWLEIVRGKGTFVVPEPERKPQVPES